MANVKVFFFSVFIQKAEEKIIYCGILLRTETTLRAIERVWRNNGTNTHPVSMYKIDK